MKILKSLMLLVTVIICSNQSKLYGQAIPTLKNAVSQSDSITTLMLHATLLDSRLTVCETALVDSTIKFYQQKKIIKRQRYWRGLKHGFGIGVVTAFGGMLYFRL